MPYLERIERTGWYTNNGPLVGELERRVAAFVDPRADAVHCVTAASGTAAVELALRAARLPPRSRVLVPSFTFPATVIAVHNAGHVAVLCDVDADAWALTPRIAESCAERSGCAAVVPVAAFGHGLDVTAWDELAARSGLVVVVDGAGALGAMAPGRHASIAFSLHATKPLGIGEGGLVATRDAALAARVRTLANYGFADGRIANAGTNAKLSEYAAAVGLAQLDRAEALLQRRDRLWHTYRAALAPIDTLRLQAGLSDRAPANVVVKLDGEAASRAAILTHEGIETRRWYCPPLHHHAAFAALERAGGLDVTDELAQRTLGLPFHTRMRTDDVARVAAALASAQLAPGAHERARPRG